MFLGFSNAINILNIIKAYKGIVFICPCFGLQSQEVACRRANLYWAESSPNGAQVARSSLSSHPGISARGDSYSKASFFAPCQDDS